MSKTPNTRAILRTDLERLLEPQRDTPPESLVDAMYAEDRQDSVDTELDLIDELLGIARDARAWGDEASMCEALEKLTARYGLPELKRTEPV
jgi:hypothetical protein